MDESEDINIVHKKVWGFWATAGFGLWVMLVNFTAQLMVIIGFVLFRLFSGNGVLNIQFIQNLSHDGLILSVSSIFSAAVSIGVILFIIKIRNGYGFKDYLGLYRPRIKTILLLLAMTSVFIVIYNSIAEFTNQEGSTFMVDVYKNNAYPVLFWITVVIFAPLFEETFFRGFLFEGFRQSQIGITGTIILTSLIWSLLHIQYGFFEIATIFLLGILIGIVRIITGSLWGPLIMHAFFNLVSMVMLSLSLSN